MGSNNNVLTQVCSNYQEFVLSNDFLRIIGLSLSQNPWFNKDYILWLFKKIWEGKKLDKTEMVALRTFANAEITQKVVEWILETKKRSSLRIEVTDMATLIKSAQFMEDFFWKYWFENARDGILRFVDEQNQKVDGVLR